MVKGRLTESISYLFTSNAPLSNDGKIGDLHRGFITGMMKSNLTRSGPPVGIVVVPKITTFSRDGGAFI